MPSVKQNNILSFVILLFATSCQATELLTIQYSDGETTKGKLHLPEATTVNTLVIFIHGTGPNTYENPREVAGKKFKYYDMFGEEFARRGIAFFSYNRRGCEIGTEPPNVDKVDREKFNKGVPSVEVADIGKIIAELRKHKSLNKAKVVLLGWSEGTMIASMVAEVKENEVAGLLLAGYAHENLFNTIKWQYSGASSMLNLRPPFDADNDGKITQEEYESDGKKQTVWREKVMQGTKFETLDRNSDGSMTAEDFRITVEPAYKQILAKIEANDADWIWDNYFRVSIGWLKEHFKLEPNKERLLRLEMPIYVFHGERDANVDVEGVRDLKKRFEKAGKKNLNAFVFEDHEHQLNFFDWVLKGKRSKGCEAIFSAAEKLDRSFE